MSRTLAVMQPYFFPYIGYWQMIHAVDDFIIYDDVNFIKSGYINRNSILVNKKSHGITLPVQGASSNKLINELTIAQQPKKIVKSIKQAYAKAPYFKEVMPVVEDALLLDEKNLAKYLTYGLTQIAKYLLIETEIHVSSQIERPDELDRTERLIHFCRHFDSDRYINAIGGQELYDKKYFQERNIELNFIKMNSIEYEQYTSMDFIPFLSIIDVMMFNERSDIKEMLNDYTLI